MDITMLINHPEQMDRETLYELRSLLALYPYFQPLRLLLLKNLYLLHDPSFDEELRRAAVYLTDRKTIFNLVEAAHYQVRVPQTETQRQMPLRDGEDRTSSLIDNFLESIPKTDEPEPQVRRKPTPADAAVDYVAYLFETETEQEEETPQLKGQSLIDDFLNNDKGKIILNQDNDYEPETETTASSTEDGGEDDYFTETLARIYIKQGRYSKAQEIIKRLSLAYPKKNAYFADQIRFLDKLIVNNSKNKS